MCLTMPGRRSNKIFYCTEIFLWWLVFISTVDNMKGTKFLTREAGHLMMLETRVGGEGSSTVQRTHVRLVTSVPHSHVFSQLFITIKLSRAISAAENLTARVSSSASWLVKTKCLNAPPVSLVAGSTQESPRLNFIFTAQTVSCLQVIVKAKTKHYSLGKFNSTSPVVHLHQSGYSSNTEVILGGLVILVVGLHVVILFSWDNNKIPDLTTNNFTTSTNWGSFKIRKF